MTRILILGLCILAGGASVLPAYAQLPLSSDDIAKVGPLFDARTSNSLNCAANQWGPRLDFVFRFTTGYMVNCRLSQFDAKKATLFIFLRVTPETKSASLFGSSYRIPELPPDMQNSTGRNFRKIKNEIGMSGAFAVGTGKYSVELLIVDDQHRSYRKKWRVNVAGTHAERSVRLAMEPLTVESLDRINWRSMAPSRNDGIRLTLMLDAAPINPFQPRLHAWDRAFLLQCIYSLLEQTPHQSVHLIAFNLDQQREVFRADQFDKAAFQNLSRALTGMETASVSVQALRNRNSPEFLAKLTNRELSAGRADAIIFLGPNARMDAKSSAAVLTDRKPASPPLFYFEYFPWPGAEFPDAIQSIVKAADGSTFKIHSPAQLDQGIQKMLHQLHQD